MRRQPWDMTKSFGSFVPRMPHLIVATSAAVAALDPRIEWTEPTEFPGGGTCHGREAVKKYLMQSRAGWAEGSSESERFKTAGDRISAFARQD